MKKISSSEITPEHLYLSRKSSSARQGRLSRRQFIKGFGALAAGALSLAACGVKASNPASSGGDYPASNPQPTVAEQAQTAMLTDELGDPATPYEVITHYNNYYEFTTDKEGVARLSKDFITSPWMVEVGGLVNNPKTYDIDDLVKLGQEERIYRLRCVEAWSMVIPWMGFPLSRLLKEVEPTSEAKYVRFETVFDPVQMPGQESSWFNWPYVEGLRLDEAMHDLTLLATGIYGKPLLPQNGAPVRLVVPWKYGFKNIKSIVKIELVKFEPISLWMDAAPEEYGFYANVNPDVDHPRWSQGTERRIGEIARRKTLLFNGYEAEVAGLYAGMSLKENY